MGPALPGRGGPSGPGRAGTRQRRLQPVQNDANLLISLWHEKWTAKSQPLLETVTVTEVFLSMNHDCDEESSLPGTPAQPASISRHGIARAVPVARIPVRPGYLIVTVW
jgi:hypothetical protein